MPGLADLLGDEPRQPTSLLDLVGAPTGGTGPDSGSDMQQLLMLGGAALGGLGGDTSLTRTVLPLVMRQQQLDRTYQTQQATRALQAKEYAALQDAITGSIHEAGGDFDRAAALLQERGSQLGLQTPEASKALFQAAVTLRDKAVAQQIKQKLTAARQGAYGADNPADYYSRGIEGEIDPKDLDAGAKTLFPSSVSDTGATYGNLRNPDATRRVMVDQLRQGPNNMTMRYDAGTNTESPVEGSMFQSLKPGEGLSQIQDGKPVTVASENPNLPDDANLKSGIIYLAQKTGVPPNVLMESYRRGDPTVTAMLRNSQALGKIINTPQTQEDILNRAAVAQPGTSPASLFDPQFINPANAQAVISQEDTRKAGQAGREAMARLPAEESLARTRGAIEVQNAPLLANARLTEQRGIEENDPYVEGGKVFYDKATEKPIRLTKGQIRQPGMQDAITAVSPQDHSTITLVRGSLPVFDGAETLIKRLLAQSQGGNLARGAELDLKRMLGSADAGQFRTLMAQINIEGGRILGGSVRVPVTMLKMLEGTMPTNYSSMQAAQRELNTLKTDLKNRVHSVVGNDLESIDVGGGSGLNAPGTVDTPFGGLNLGGAR